MQLDTNLPDSSRLERVAPALSSGFPYWADRYHLHHTPEHSYPWHWHTEIELFYITEGQIDYFVPSGVYHATVGDVGFINSGALHMTRCPGGMVGVAEEHIFLPQFMDTGGGSDIERKYLLPLLQSSADMILIPGEVPEAQAIRTLMTQAYDVCQARAWGYELKVRALISEIWLMLLHYVEQHQLLNWAGHGNDNDRIKAMMNHIRKHYKEKLTLSDIAASALVGPRECCRCFQRQLGITPFEYLIEYRIGKACTLLRQTRLPITEVAASCGFASSSYFGKVFKEKMNCTPKDYRTGLKTL